MIVVEHESGRAIVSLQGAQLLSWQPKYAAQDLLWLSDAEPFKQGWQFVAVCRSVIRGLVQMANRHTVLRACVNGC